MSTVPTALAAALLLAIATLWPTSASACKCGQQTIAEAERSASGIFEGRVEAIETASDGQSGAPAPLRVQLAVVRRFKGADAERLQVRTRADGAACGFAFERDKSYLIYADAQDGQLWVNRCGRTRPIADADEDLGALGMGTTPVEVKNTPPDAEPADAADAAPDCGIVHQRVELRGACGAVWAPWLVGGLLALRRLRPSRRSRSRS